MTFAADAAAAPATPTKHYAWLVFALTFGLLVSDYMSRQVLSAVFPLLRAEWSLSDGQLGALSSIVALMVGLLTLPLSALADRFGRSRSLVIMALLWSLATAACAVARDYQEMFWARFMVGVGEAAYGSVGIAVVLGVFPKSLRATLTGAFMAGGLFGSMLGVSLGGAVAGAMGWRPAFGIMALVGIALSAAYALCINDRRLAAAGAEPANAAVPQARGGFASLFATGSVFAAYLGSGLQLFICAAIPAWAPSFLNRYYDIEPGRAAVLAAGFILVGGVGMVLGGIVNDILVRRAPGRTAAYAAAICLTSGVLLLAAFQLPTGWTQLGLIATGLFVGAAIPGPAGAMVANLTDPKVHGSAFATLTLANNFLGLAPGAYVTGLLADRLGGLLESLQLIPVTCLVAGSLFLAVTRRYGHDLERRP
ncbi:MAG TPA: MFS transporter [Caulobacter sp.]|nr:MFS transporter [Caulobacter sp.]